MLLFPLENLTVEMVFMKVARENINRLLFHKNQRHNMAWILPEVKHQYRLFQFQRKATMKN